MTRSREDARDAVPGFDDRVDVLRPLCHPGPRYKRRVREELLAAFNAWEPEHVGARLVTAEIAAGLRPEDDYLTRFDPETWKAVPA